jgi:predicted MFS family arabinose efflux permease
MAMKTQTEVGRPELRDFNIFWASETIADLFERFTALAIPLLAISVFGATPMELGILGSMATFPLLLVTPFAGVLVDRWRTGRLLIIANFARAALLACICLFGLGSLLSLPLLATLAGLVGVVAAVSNVATLAYVPVIVRREQLAVANTRVSLTTAVADTLGPAFGGLLIGVVGAAGSIGATAVAFAVAGAFLISIKAVENIKVRQPFSAKLVVTQISQGMRRTILDRHVGPMAVASAWFNAFEQVFLINLLLVMTRGLGLTSTQIGIVLAASGVGGVLGGLVAHRLQRQPPGVRLLAGKAFSALGPIVVGAGILIPSAGFPLLLVGLGLFGFGTTVYNVHAVTLRQLLVDPAILGRVSASYRFIAHGSIPLGALLAGVIGTSAGPSTAVVVAAVAIVAGSAVFALTPPARLRADPVEPTLTELG